MKHYVSLAGFIGLGIGFIGLGAAIGREAFLLRKTNVQIENSSERLQQHALQLQSIMTTMKKGQEESAFLRGIAELIPDDQSHLRVQNAVADEVALLRRKVGRLLRGGLHILVDTRGGKFYVKRGMELLWSGDCSAGRGGVLVDKATGRRWEFVTPRGKLRVLSKWPNPSWTRPDWAFVETGEPIPPPNDPKRKVPGELGNYVLNLGDGYLIHGTRNEALLGRPASHGCIRLGAANLEKVYQDIPVGTPVYIY